MTDPCHLSYNDLLAENRRLKERAEIDERQRGTYYGILQTIGYYSSDTQFCSLNLTDSQRDTLGRACEMSVKSPEETIHEALECWLDYKKSCQRSKRFEAECEVEGKFGK